jgi:hypothetical protein
MIMMLATADGTRDQCHGSEPEEEAVECRLVGGFRVGGLREQCLHGRLVTGGGAHVDRARRAATPRRLGDERCSGHFDTEVRADQLISGSGCSA